MILEKGQRVDWFRVIVDLTTKHGYTTVAIAAAVDSRKSTVLGWKQGSSPKFEDGERLIGLWCQVSGKSRDSVPTVSRYSCLS